MTNRRAFLALLPSLTVVLCTLLITIVVVRREFFPNRTLPFSDLGQPPVLVPNWQEIAGTGHRMGPADAALTVVVFSDFECPACRQFASNTYPELAEKYGERVALVYRHWPLTNHRFAYPAARAAECAAQQGRFEAFYRLVYDHQDSLGFKPFERFAAESGVRDLTAFDACARDTKPVPKIEADIKAALWLDAVGTPAILVNGWHMRGRASAKLMDSIAQSLVPLKTVASR